MPQKVASIGAVWAVYHLCFGFVSFVIWANDSGRLHTAWTDSRSVIFPSLSLSLLFVRGVFMPPSCTQAQQKLFPHNTLPCSRSLPSLFYPFIHPSIQPCLSIVLQFQSQMVRERERERERDGVTQCNGNTPHSTIHPSIQAVVVLVHLPTAAYFISQPFAHKRPFCYHFTLTDSVTASTNTTMETCSIPG